MMFIMMLTYLGSMLFCTTSDNHLINQWKKWIDFNLEIKFHFEWKHLNEIQLKKIGMQISWEISKIYLWIWCWKSFFFFCSTWKLTTCYNSHLIYFFGCLCLHWWSEMTQLIGLTWNCIGDNTSIEQAKKIV